MSGSEQIFEWESITQPSYWGGQILAPNGQAAMSQIVATGANTVTIIPNFFQHDQNSSSTGLNIVDTDPTKPWANESDTFDGVRKSILSAKAHGLKVVLKPHLETDNRVWRAKITPGGETTPGSGQFLKATEWFASYKSIMVEYAKAAQAGGADMICVGTEMDSMINPLGVCSDGVSYTQKWEEIIAAVRAVYSGKVTYAATYWTVKDVGFWDKVDYIGVDAYWAMTPKHAENDPSPYTTNVNQMVEALTKPHFNPYVSELHDGKSIVEWYKALSEQYGRKVIFTEVGYRSLDGSTADPGVFGGREQDPPDFQEQVDAYKALYKVMENYGGQWLAGSFLWSYYSFENPMLPVDQGGANVWWTDYTTQHKPANDIVTYHYSSPAHETGLVWNGTANTDKLDGGYHNDTLNGAGGNDILWGGAGNDVMSGGDGADAMTGGDGDDTYSVDAAGDKVIEAVSGGTDLVISTVSLALSANVENLALSGTGALLGTGNELANTITGNSGANGLSSGGGDDRLIGEAGKDTLKGEAGNDKISGGAGNDKLYGGKGSGSQDMFVFDTKLTSKSIANKNKDTIYDFGPKYDAFGLDDAAFTNKIIAKYLKGKTVSLDTPIAIKKGWFVLDGAKDKDDFFIAKKVNATTYTLYWDSDGSGAKAALEIATVKLQKGEGVALTYKDFFFI
ncbi:glycoside hydrolase family 113 [Microvirga calopogonii]|uniref:glycoside hydrolase family 113 n=1 Tax=Microvirga calopogonii TaxID=2078013 RepID=UPI000E0DBDDC|nr:hypothetical protein [Microvirga calopogonii]